MAGKRKPESVNTPAQSGAPKNSAKGAAAISDDASAEHDPSVTTEKRNGKEHNGHADSRTAPDASGHSEGGPQRRQGRKPTRKPGKHSKSSGEAAVQPPV